LRSVASSYTTEREFLSFRFRWGHRAGSDDALNRHFPNTIGSVLFPAELLNRSHKNLRRVAYPVFCGLAGNLLADDFCFVLGIAVSFFEFAGTRSRSPASPERSLVRLSEHNARHNSGVSFMFVVRILTEPKDAATTATMYSSQMVPYDSLVVNEETTNTNTKEEEYLPSVQQQMEL
jgi:hypothetical protein